MIHFLFENINIIKLAHLETLDQRLGKLHGNIGRVEKRTVSFRPIARKVCSRER